MTNKYFQYGARSSWIFLEISKAFDNTWNNGLIFKLHQNDICSELINILEDFLSPKKQRAVLNGQCSFWDDIRAVAKSLHQDHVLIISFGLVAFLIIK